MKILRTQNKSSLIMFVCIFSFLNSCSNNSFKKEALNAADILQNAFKLEQFDTPKSVVEHGRSLVRIYSNKDKSKKYLAKNREKLNTIYKKIRPFADQPDSENYFNALFICATINQTLYMLSGSSFEDELDIVNKVRETKSINNIADWVVNEFYGKIEVPEDLLKDWILMERSKKIETIYNGIIFKSNAIREPSRGTK